MRSTCKNRNTRNSIWIEEETFFFYCQSCSTLEKVAQRGCRVSILGDTQKLSGHHPRQPPVGNHVWVGMLDKVTSRHLFWTQPFCDTVMLLWSLVHEKGRQLIFSVGSLQSGAANFRNAKGAPAARSSGRDPNKHIKFAVGRSGM